MTSKRTISTESDKPPNLQALRPAPWRVALIANLREELPWDPGAPPDAGAEFDRPETLEALTEAMEADGHYVHFCRADSTLPEALIRLRPHMAFNIAEGEGGDAREAQVPALLELLKIPYTASRVLCHALSLDKVQTKRVWQASGLPTAKFWEFASEADASRASLRYPLFVKPAREGTGMGIDGGAVVRNKRELVKRVAWITRTYRQPALVEEYLRGREFTVGFIGRPGSRRARRRPWLYDDLGYHFFPVLEIDSAHAVSPGIYGHDAKARDIDAQGAPGYLCPADIPEALRARLVDLARQAAEAIDTLDVARVDFRLGVDGEPYLLEINTLPGLNPIVSDICMMAAAEGMPYRTLITEILYLAADRFGLPFETKLVPDSSEGALAARYAPVAVPARR
ncbi:MAG: D-alanine--D-alanine ligase family protein [Anaerolineales bacterium]